MKESGSKVTINEKLVIDLNNHPSNIVTLFVDKINKNELNQDQKDCLDGENMTDNEMKVQDWAKKTTTMKIKQFDEGKETEIVINAEAYVTNGIPSQEHTPSILEGEVTLCGRDVMF
jgi:hypothetical protein